MISDKILSNSKFYNKPIAIFFTSKNCNNCEKLYENIKLTYIGGRYLWKYIDGDEYLHYLIRLSRGITPSITVINHEPKILGIIESDDVKFLESSLRKIYEGYISNTLKPVPIPTFIPEPKDFDINIIHELIIRATKGELVDYRAYKVIKFYENIYNEKNIEKFLNNIDIFTKILITRKISNEIDKNFAFNVAVLVEFGMEKVEELLKFINDDGSVNRSTRKEVKGLLIDQCSVGNALIGYYEIEDKKDVKEIIEKIYKYISSKLIHEKGFLDYPKEDVITNYEFLEPLANAEAALFLARYWAVFKDQNAKELSYKAIKCAFGGSDNLRVLGRLIIAYLKLFSLILTRRKDIDDPRVEILDNECGDKFWYDNKCYNEIKEIELTQLTI
jgi:hypothetical protein